MGLLIYRLFLTMKKTKHPLANMIVAAGVSMIGFSFLWNIGMVFGWLPVIGVSLPFVSYAGMHQLIYSVFVGMILSVYRRKDLVQLRTKPKKS